jgi:hypothetical protein
MTAIGRIRLGAAMGLVVASAAWSPGVARSQSIAYTPNVSSILDGAALNATPVVSADRRYVRLTLNPYFNTVNGFSTYSAPVAAVSGGGNLAGMGGVIGGGGGAVGPMGSMSLSSSTGTYLAGEYSPPPVPSAAGFVESVDPFDQAAAGPSRAAGANRRLAGEALAADSEMADPFALSDAPEEPSVRAGKTSAARRKAARKAPRRPATTKSKRRP